MWDGQPVAVGSIAASGGGLTLVITNPTTATITMMTTTAMMMTMTMTTMTIMTLLNNQPDTEQ
jgi:hypothetical protein